MGDAPLLASDVTRHAAMILHDAGIAEPRREAARLWRDLITASEGSTCSRGGNLSSRYLDWVRRRAQGEPLAYVTGWTGFRHLVLATDRRALIPRPETEGLVGLALQRISWGRAADIGTGTGAIALSLAHEGRFDRVIGIDLSRDALDLAVQNARSSEIRIDCVLGDLVGALGEGSCDLIVSNPPYLAQGELERLDPSVRDWEPILALDGGVDGMDPYRRLFREVPRVLRPGGWMALEIDARRPEDTAALAVTSGWSDVTIHDDLFGRARYLMARRETRG